MSDIIPSFVTTDMNEFNLKRVCVCVCALILNLKFCVLFYLSSLTVLTRKKKKKRQKKLFGSVFFSENAKHFLRTEWHRLVNKRLECVQTYIMDV